MVLRIILNYFDDFFRDLNDDLEMKKIMMVLAALLLQTSAHANECTARVWLDPSIGKSFTRTVIKSVKKKGYKMLSDQAAVFEDYRFVISLYPDYVRFYMQEFVAPHFRDMVRVDEPSKSATHEQTIMTLLANIPECERD